MVEKSQHTVLQREYQYTIEETKQRIRTAVVVPVRRARDFDE
jgi:hypothetical protein